MGCEEGITFEAPAETLRSPNPGRCLRLTGVACLGCRTWSAACRERGLPSPWHACSWRMQQKRLPPQRARLSVRTREAHVPPLG